MKPESVNLDEPRPLVNPDSAAIEAFEAYEHLREALKHLEPARRFAGRNAMRWPLMNGYLQHAMLLVWGEADALKTELWPESRRAQEAAWNH